MVSKARAPVLSLARHIYLKTDFIHMLVPVEDHCLSRKAGLEHSTSGILGQKKQTAPVVSTSASSFWLTRTFLGVDVNIQSLWPLGTKARIASLSKYTASRVLMIFRSLSLSFSFHDTHYILHREVHPTRFDNGDPFPILHNANYDMQRRSWYPNCPFFIHDSMLF